MNRQERQALAERMPWVKRLKTPVPCQGWKAPRGSRDCKNQAHWSFRHSAKHWLYPKQTRNYCWAHLVSRGIYGSMEEEARTKKWMHANGFPDEGTVVTTPEQEVAARGR